MNIYKFILGFIILSIIYQSISIAQGVWIDQTISGSGSSNFEAISFVDENTGMVAGGNGKIFKTVDGGYTWTQLQTGTNTYFKGLYFAGNEAWACGGAGKIYYTADAGLTWSAQTSGTPKFLNAIYFSGSVGIVVGEDNAIVYTMNGGVVWNAAFVPGSSVNLYAVNIIGSTAYACGQGGKVLKSIDGGATWTIVSGPFSGTLKSLKFLDATTGFIAGSSGKVYKTVDGITFTQVTNAGGTVSNACSFVNPNTGWVIGVPIDTIFWNNYGLYKTTNAGLTWNAQVSPVLPGYFNGMDFASDQAGWACGVGGTIIRYTTKPPKISAPTSHDFGTLLCTNTKDDTLYVRNIGLGPMNIMKVQFTGPNANEFTLVLPPSGKAVVQPNDSARLVVRWAASGAGTKSAVMKIKSNDPTKPYWDITLTARKDSVIAEITPSTINFDTVCVGQTAIKKIAAKAGGTFPATLTDFLWVSGDVIFTCTNPSFPFALNLSTPDTIQLRFEPTSYGNFSAVYKFTYMPCNRDVRVTLKGTANESKISITPDSSFSFGDVQLGQSLTQTFSIRSTGNKLARIASISLLPPSSDFSFMNLPTVPLVMNPGDVKTFKLKFAPATLGNSKTKILIKWDAQCADSLAMPIDGQGINSPQIDAPLSRTLNIPLCSTAVFDTIKITNTGGLPLVISDAAFTGASASSFSLSSPKIPATIQPNDTIKFVIQFADNVAGSKSASLNLTSNDPKNSPVTIVFSAQREIASFAVRGDTMQAMESCIGKRLTRDFKLVNSGSVQITIKSVAMIDTGNVFHVSINTTPLTIEPGQDVQFEIDFTPPSIGQLSGRLLITAEPCSLSSVVTLQGIGIKTVVDAQPTKINFNDVNTGTYSEQLIEFTNNGATSITIDSLFFIPPAASLQFVSLPTLPYQLNVSDKFSALVRFSPTTTDSMKTVLYMRASLPCPDTIRIPVDGNGTSASISINRAALNYLLSACTNSSACDTILISNTGTASVDVTDISITPQSNVFDIKPKPALPIVLNSKQTYRLIVCANGIFSGQQSSTLSITSTDPQRPTITIPLAAQRDSSAIQISSSALSFGVMASCDSAKTILFTITNTGNVRETITANSIADTAFTMLMQFPFDLKAGESKQLTVRFNPEQYRVYSDSLILQSSVCNRQYIILMNGEKAKPTYIAAPGVIDFKKVLIGSTSSITLQVTNASSLKSHWSSYSFSPIVTGLTLTSPSDQQLDPNASKDFTFNFTPQDTNSFSSRYCLIIDSPCPDTICIIITGQGIRGSITLSKSQLRFGKLAQCQVQHDTIVCTNTGNAPVDITSSTITGVGASSFSILNPTVSTEILNPNQSRAYFVDFHPSSTPDGIVDATLQIQTTDTQRPTIDIPLQGERVTQVAPIIANVDFGNVNVGETKTVQAVVKNTGTSTLCIDSVSSLPSNVSLLTPLPLCLQAGEQKNISLLYAPAVVETLLTFIQFLMNTPCNDSVNVQLAGNGIAGGLIQTAAIQFGMIASCLTKSDTIIIENKYSSPGRDAILERISINGVDSNLFKVIQPASLPITIATNTSQRIVILFDASLTIDGIKQANCKTILKVDTSMRTFTTQLNATVVTPIINVNQVTFPITTIGLSTNQTTSITNSNPFPIVITDVNTSDSAFAVQSTTPALPTTLLPGQSLNVTLRFSPTMEKVYSSLIDVQSNSPCNITGSGNISGEGKAQSITTVGASIDSYHARLDEIISVPIMLDADVGSASVASWSGDVSFNRTMLYPKRIAIENSLSKNMNVSSTYDHKTGTLQISASGAQLLNGMQPLVNVEFQVLLGNDVQTAITIAPTFDFTSGTARIVKRTNGLFQLEGYCRAGDRLLQILGTYSLQQNRPNPLNPSTKIEYEIGVDGFVSLIVLDVMGREVDRLVNEYKKMGRYEVEFHSRDLPSGMYYYLLRSGRFSDVKKMVIAR